MKKPKGELLAIIHVIRLPDGAIRLVPLKPPKKGKKV